LRRLGRRFTFLKKIRQDRAIAAPAMPLSNPVEWMTAFLAASVALWFVGRSLPWGALQPKGGQPLPLAHALLAYLQRPGLLGSIGLLLLRLSIGLLMIHHGQEKLADPQQFASTYVASLHLPFPLFFAYAAGFSELIGSWLVILGLLTPLGALALSSTMAVAAVQHILTGGFNIYVLELVLLYLGGSLAILLNGPGRFSFDAGMAPLLLNAGMETAPEESGRLQAVVIPVNKG
jgi:putative oxidoreductase